MSDERLRELERRWRASGTVEDEAAWLHERVRAGDLTQERLEIAARCGYLAAGLGTDQETEARRMSEADILVMLADIQEAAGELAVVIAAAAAARLVLPLWEEAFPEDERGRAAIELSEAWARSPDREHMDRLDEATANKDGRNLLIDAGTRPKRDPVSLAGRALNAVDSTVSEAHGASESGRHSYLFGARGAVGKSADVAGEDAVRVAMIAAVGRFVLEAYQPASLHDYEAEAEERARQAQAEEHRSQEEAARLAAIPVRRYSRTEHFVVGDRVRHGIYGLGEVVASAGKNAEIEFEDGIRRKLAQRDTANE